MVQVRPRQREIDDMVTGLMLLSVLLCLIAGSAIDTGSICVVRAVNDGMAGKPALAIGCLVTLLCAALVFTLDRSLHWNLRSPPWAWPTARILGGAALFAAGAVLNGACAVGTLTRLCRGDIGYLTTMSGRCSRPCWCPGRCCHSALPTPTAMAGGCGWR